MSRVALALAFILLTAALVGAAPAARTVIEVYTPNVEIVAALADFPVGFEDPDREDWSRVVCAPATADRIRAAGFEVNVLIPDLDAFVAGRARVMAALPAPKTPPADVLLDHYLTHEEIGTFLAELAAAYPTIMSFQVIGQSVLGRAMWAVKISDNVLVDENEPAVFFEHTIHGDEIAGYIMGLSTIQYLVTNYGTDPEVTNLVNSLEIFVEPLTNPDGNYDAPFYGRVRYNDNGVDLNRNFGYMWDPNEWNSGSAPHSEPETTAVSEFWEGDQPFTLGVSGHGGAVMFLYSWGYKGADPPDIAEFDYLGDEYIYPGYCQDPNMDVYGTCYQALYQAIGVSNDEMYGAHGMLGLTWELSYDKQCSFATSQQIFNYHLPGILWIMGQMENGLHGTVTDADTGDPVAATILVQNRWNTFTDPAVGDYHKYLRAGNYQVTAFANGYEPQTLPATIVNETPTTLDFELEPADDTVYAWRWMVSRMPKSESSAYPPANALGAPDGDFISLGSGGYVVLDLGPDGISDGTGDDIAVYEGYTDGAEDFSLWVSDTSAHGPWTNVGFGSGSTSFDLDDAGVSHVRWVSIRDTADEESDPSEAADTAGFDLDAVGTPAFVAAFNADPTSGGAPLDVQFTDNSTGDVTAWAWTFGDGATSTEQNPAHTYTANGLYDVTLEVTGSEGVRSLTKTDYINVYDVPPTAEFVGAPVSGAVPLDVTFTDQSTGTIDTWAWTFGDGATSDQADPVHTFTEPGRYTVALTVSGAGGSDTRSRWRYINATCSPPQTDFDADVTTGPAPLAVQFENLTTVAEGCPIKGYGWNFGDGETSIEENPTHTFAAPGSYTVSLTAMNDVGQIIETKTDFITVTGDDDDDTTDDDTGDDDTADDDDDDDDATDDDNDDASDDDDDDDDDSGCGC